MTEVVSRRSLPDYSVEPEQQPVVANAFPIAAWPWIALLFVGFLPLLARFGVERWLQPHYQFFPLMILAAAYIGWQRLQEMPAGHFAPRVRALSTVLMVASFVLLVTATAWWTAYLAAVAALLALVAVVWFLGGLPMLWTLAPSLVLLAVIVGVPIRVEAALLTQMRVWAVGSSSVALIWLRIPHMISGTVIEIPSSRLLVEEACSGINSMMAVLGFTLVLGFLRRRSPAVTAILTGAGVIFVLWANMIRIVGGAVLKAVWSVDILSGGAHQLASIVLFTVCMGLVFSTDELISLVQSWREARQWRFRGGSPPSEQSVTTRPQIGARAVHLRITWGLWLTAAIFTVVGAAQVVHGVKRGAWGILMTYGLSVSGLREGAVFTVPPTIGRWERLDINGRLTTPPESFGVRSMAWSYRQDDVSAIVALDYPFQRYHELTSCYTGAGWTVDDSAIKAQADGAGGFAVVSVRRLYERGYLWFASMDETGNWMEQPSTTVPDGIIRNYQIQVWVPTTREVSAQQQQQLEQLFLAVRQDLARQVLRQLQK